MVTREMIEFAEVVGSRLWPKEPMDGAIYVGDYLRRGYITEAEAKCRELEDKIIQYEVLVDCDGMIVTKVIEPEI